MTKSYSMKENIAGKREVRVKAQKAAKYRNMIRLQ